MNPFAIAPRHGKLVQQAEADALAKQDAEREAARAKIRQSKDPYGDFRRSFTSSIAYEFTLAAKWGASAETYNSTTGKIVVVPIGQKYPPRKPSRFETWLCSFRNGYGAPYFQFSPAKHLPGFIFNEGGRVLTFTSTQWSPFRLYILGWILMRRDKKWSFRHK